MIDRLRAEQALPANWVFLIRDLCHRLNVNPNLWPVELTPFLDVAIREYARQHECSEKDACRALDTSYDAFRKRRYRRAA